MCSIVEEDFGDDGGVHAMVPEPKPVAEINEICKKCNETAAILKLSHKEPQCRRCFLNYVRHKFRAMLGATKIVKKNSNILVLADGTAESLAMLDMIKFGLEDEMFKRLHVNVGGVLLIDDLFLEVTDEERGVLLESLKNNLNYLGMKLFYVTLADGDNVMDFDNFTFNKPLEDAFKEKLSKLNSLTSQQDYVRVLKDEITCKVAKSLECPFIFSAEISIDIAKKLLSNISLGRGASLADDVAFSNNRNQILRPMKDVSPIEVMHYLRLNDLTPIILPQFGQNRGESASIQNLTSNFVDGLQSQFASTVSTVSKTGDKLRTKSYNQKLFCKLCKAEVDCKDSETLFAVEYSRIVAKHSKEHILQPEFIEDQAKQAVDGIDEQKSQLCHGCRNIFLNSNDSEDFLSNFLQS